MNEENEKLNNNQDTPENVIIIKAKDQIYTFEKGIYREDLLLDIVSKRRFEEIIDKAGRTMGHSWATKRANDQIKIPGTVIVLSIVAVILTIVYMITLYTSTTADDGTALFVVSIICISASSIIVFGLSIYNFCRKIEKFQSLDMIIKEDLDKEFNKLNSEFSGLLKFYYNEVKKQIEITVLRKYGSKVVSNMNNLNMATNLSNNHNINNNNQEIEMNNIH